MSGHTRVGIDRELDIVNAQIEILQRREDDFQHLLEDIERLRNSIREEKAALERKGRDLALERYPIHWLPVELLIQVFIQFVEDEDTEDLSRWTQKEELYHRPPVILSHVCHKWRAVTLSTSHLWSRIVCTLAKPDSLVPLRLFLTRASNSPLDIVYHAPTKEKFNFRDESRRMVDLLSSLAPHISRSRSMFFECHGADSMKQVLDILKSSPHEFPFLESLDLSIVVVLPSFSNRSLYIDSAVIERLGKDVAAKKPSTPLCVLKHLRLEQVPLFNIPIPFLLNLTSLELRFPVVPVSGFRYTFRMSSFCLFLSCIPRLTTLVLCDTVPLFDLVFAQDGNGQDSTHLRKPIELLWLKRFDWSFPFPTDVHPFLMFLSVPSLEIFDLSLDKRSDTRLQRGHDALTDSNGAVADCVLQFNALKELYIHGADEDAICSILRKLSFRVLEKVEISNMLSPHASKPSRTSLPTLPRLESIFRDPRLPYLTQFTLSHFKISPEHVRAMLGYMPALVSLLLDSCTCVRELIDALADQATILVELHGEGNRQRGAKFCPRLQGISLWGCMDVGFPTVKNFVEARNIRFVEGSDVKSEKASQTEVVVSTRKIRPLRKIRRNNTTAQPPLSSMAEESHQHVSYVCIRGCALVQEREALSLKELGVDEVRWG